MKTLTDFDFRADNVREISINIIYSNKILEFN